MICNKKLTRKKEKRKERSNFSVVGIFIKVVPVHRKGKEHGSKDSYAGGYNKHMEGDSVDRGVGDKAEVLTLRGSEFNQ